MGGIGSKLEEIQEFEQAQQEMEKQEEPKRKLSMREKLRTRILRGDPRSASDGVDRTPIALSKQSGSELSSTTIEMNTPENKLKTLSLVDPRSPGEIDRTPIQIEEQPVRRRVLAGDECETPVRSAVHHSLVNKLELDARTQLIIDDGSRDESGIDGLSPIVAVKPPIDVINIQSALNDTPKTLEFSGLDTNADAGKPAVQMRAGGARGQPHKILQERLRSVVQSQLISDTPQTAPAAEYKMSVLELSSDNLVTIEEKFKNVREVGNQATWSLSSCKPGYGVHQLRDGSLDTYWQNVAIYTDYKLDESYTPTKISVRVGTNFNDLQEIEVVDIQEPSGWIVIPLKDINDKLIRTFMLQIAVLQNHQQGRDTHMRQIKIHSPVQDKPISIAQQRFTSFIKSKMPTSVASPAKAVASPAKKPRVEESSDILQVAKLTEHAIIPTRGSKLAAGYDLYSAYDYTIPPRGKVLAKTDIQIKVPHGTYGRVAPRSGLAWKQHIDIGAGVVDEDYRGNVGVVMFNHSEVEVSIKAGDRIAQLVCEKISYPEIQEFETLDDTERGEGGFGSTGTN